MNIVAIIASRMASSRLPGKAMMLISNKPMLQRVIERTQRAKRISMVGVATTTLPSDDEIAAWCVAHNVPVFRGHPTDVLDRYARAAELWRADAVVRVTGDCPLWDAAIGDAVIAKFLAGNYAYASNISDGYVDGTDSEVFTADLLQLAHAEAMTPYMREHVSVWMRENCERQGIVLPKVKLPGVKISVDTADDLALVRRIYAALGDGFTIKDIARWARRERIA